MYSLGGIRGAIPPKIENSIPTNITFLNNFNSVVLKTKIATEAKITPRTN